MNILIGLTPALLWGAMPVTTTKIGGRPVEQLLGTAYGAIILGALSYLIVGPSIPLITFFWCFISGVFWSVSQEAQYTAYRQIDVSVLMPITSGIQIIGVSLVGVLFFGSWSTGFKKLTGALAILMIVIGIILTAIHDRTDQPTTTNKSLEKKGFANAIFSSLGYTVCNSLPKIPKASGWQMFFPMMLGIVVTAIIIGLSNRNFRQHRVIISKYSFRNILTGIFFGLAYCGYFFSINLNNLSTGFVLSQMCLIVSTFSGIIILHEHKTRNEMIRTVVGLILIIISGLIVSKL